MKKKRPSYLIKAKDLKRDPKDQQYLKEFYTTKTPLSASSADRPQMSRETTPMKGIANNYHVIHRGLRLFFRLVSR